MRLLDLEEIICQIKMAKKKKIFVVGDIILDEYLYGTVERVSSGIRIPIVEKGNSIFCLGGAANIAANLAGLSDHVTMLGAVGNDDAGKNVKRLFQHYGINLVNLLSKFTIKKQRIYIDNQQVLRLDNEIRTAMKLDVLETVLGKEHFDTIVLADYLYGMIDDAVIHKCVEYGEKCGIPVLLTSREITGLKLEGIHAVVVNQREAESFACISERDISITHWHKGVKDYFITWGNKGIFYQNALEKTIAKTDATYPVNVSGAGDTVFSIISAFYSGSMEREILLEIANIAGYQAIKHELTYTITADDLIVGLYKKCIDKDLYCKVVDLDTGYEIVRAWKNKGKKVVFTNGCYDILHLGHLKSFSAAREKGDRLVVAINTDESIKRQKGEKRPINTLEERMYVLAHLGMIDLIIPFGDDTAVEVMKRIYPSVYVKGEEYRNKDIEETQYAEQVEYIPMIEGISTSNIIRRVEEIR